MCIAIFLIVRIALFWHCVCFHYWHYVPWVLCFACLTFMWGGLALVGITLLGIVCLALFGIVCVSRAFIVFIAIFWHCV